jgi:hypothetical protein
MAEDTGRKPEDDDQDPDEDDDPDSDPEETLDELKARLKKVSGEAKKWRLRAVGRDADWKPGTKDDKPLAAKDKPDADKPANADEIRREVRAELEAEFEEKASDNNLRAAVSVALLSAGLALSDEQSATPAKARAAVSRVVSMMNLRNLTLESDGEVAGLDDELAELKENFPGLFRAAGTGNGRPGARTRGSDGAPRGKGGGQQKDPVHDLAAAFFKS